MRRISSGIHPDVFLEKDDTVIFSSKIIPGNEKKLYAMHNEIVKNNIEIIRRNNRYILRLQKRKFQDKFIY